MNFRTNLRRICAELQGPRVRKRDNPPHATPGRGFFDFLVRIAGHLRRDARVAVFCRFAEKSVINGTENCKKEGPAAAAAGAFTSDMHYKDSVYFPISKSPSRYWMPMPRYGVTEPPAFTPTPACTPQLQRGGGIRTLFVTVMTFVRW